MIARYKNPDNDPRGPWLLSDLAARNFYGQGTYPITTPKGRRISGPPAGSYWRVSKEKFDALAKDNRIWWGESEETPTWELNVSCPKLRPVLWVRQSGVGKMLVALKFQARAFANNVFPPGGCL